MMDTDLVQRILSALAYFGCRPKVVAGILGGLTTPVSGPSNGVVYLAGPMRGIPGYNFPMFDLVRDRYVSNGWAVFSPADIDRASKDDAPDVDPTTGGDVASTLRYVYRDTMVLMAMAYLAERGYPASIITLPRWPGSVGASAEVALARWLKIGHGLASIDAPLVG
jgi:hypothetical protein